jgi:hypothetical protein
MPWLERTSDGKLYKAEVALDASNNNFPYIKLTEIVGISVPPDSNIYTRSAPLRQGMTRQRIIELANKRTRGIGEKRIDFDAEFLGVLQELCSTFHWHWRRLSVGVPFLVGQAEYDLSDPTIGADSNMIDVQQLVSVRLFPTSTEVIDLRPMFEEDQQECALEDDTTGVPTHFFLVPGTLNTLRLYPTPNRSYWARVSYWALPNMATDGQTDLVPLVPGFLHMTLVDGLEAQIYRYALDKGERSTEYLAARDKFDRAIARATRARDFAAGRVREWNSSEGAVRST